jgi:hypothetical protein
MTNPPHTEQLHVALKSRGCYILHRALYSTAVSTPTLQQQATAPRLQFWGHFNKHLLLKSINRRAITLGFYFHKDTLTFFSETPAKVVGTKKIQKRLKVQQYKHLTHMCFLIWIFFYQYSGIILKEFGIVTQ